MNNYLIRFDAKGFFVINTGTFMQVGYHITFYENKIKTSTVVRSFSFWELL